MESSAASGLRSRSRSKTPFLRSSCDHENCMLEDEEHVHLKTGRKTPVNRSTPIKQLHAPTKQASEVITEEERSEEHKSTRTVHSTKETYRKTDIKTSDYSSEESLDRLKSHGKEIIQNELNSQHERVSTSTQQYGNLGEVTLSPIYKSPNLTHSRSRSSRIGSPTHSACSTDSSFAEQALADTSVLLETNPNTEHLPYRLYKMAGEYWNKYPKTDYTYSRMSKDRVELAPGQVAVPNMSRRSLSMFRIQGPNTSLDELDRMAATTSWTTSTNAWNTGTTLRKRYTSVDSSDDESSYGQRNGAYRTSAVDQRWWITRLLMTIITTITTTTSHAYRTLVGPSHRYPYTERHPANAKANLVSQIASFVAAPFFWIYAVIKKMVTTTVTTVTETITTNDVGEKSTYLAKNYKEVNKLESRKEAKRRWWPWFLLLLLPLIGYGSYYSYENWDDVPTLADISLHISNFTTTKLKNITLPNITLPEFHIPSLSLEMPDINITLPDITDNLPDVKKTYGEYRDIVQNRMSDASEYMKVVAESCFEEMKRFWRGIIG